jgi:hypothetical protein
MKPLTSIPSLAALELLLGDGKHVTDCAACDMNCRRVATGTQFVP